MLTLKIGRNDRFRHNYSEVSTKFIAKATDYSEIRPTNRAFRSNLKYKDMLLGNKIKELRDKHEVLQRQLAAYLEIDTPMFSKIERGDRRAKRSQVILLAKYFHIDEKEMLTLWLADKVLDALEGEEELCLDALDTARSELTDVNR